MVIEEIGKVNSNPDRDHPKKLYAPIQDRILAAFFDAFLVMPFVSLAAIPMFRVLKVDQALGSNAIRMVMIYLNISFIYVGLSTLFLAAWCYAFKGTPGQRLMRMQLLNSRNVSDGGPAEEPSYYKYALRFLLWWLSFAFLGIPFFEILANPRRQAVYDKICDLNLYTEKSRTDLAPSKIESHILYRWILSMSLVILGTFGLAYYKIQDSLLDSPIMSPDADLQSCLEQPDDESDLEAYIDRILTKGIAKLESKSCMEELGDYVLWSESQSVETVHGWGYFAKAMASPDRSSKEEYLLEACKSYPDSEACTVSKYMLSGSEDRENLLKNSGINNHLVKLLMVETAIQKQQFAKTLPLIQELREDESLVVLADRLQVRAMWKLLGLDDLAPSAAGLTKLNHVPKEKKTERTPAAAANLENDSTTSAPSETNKELLVDFQKRFLNK